MFWFLFTKRCVCPYNIEHENTPACPAPIKSALRPGESNPSKSNPSCICFLIFKVKKEVGDVEIVINNAGAIYPADLLSTKDEEITKTFEVNILGHFWVSGS